MRVLKRTCLFLFFVLLPAIVLCQQKTIFFEQFTEKDGLSNSYVTSVVQDKKGYLWIGTYDGLNRYDGREFKIFRTTDGDSTSIQSNVVSFLLLRKDGRIMIGFRTGGVSIFDWETETFRNFYPSGKKNALPPGEITTVFEDEQGAVWLGVVRKGIYKWNENKCEHVFDLPDIDAAYTSGSRSLQYCLFHGTGRI